MREYHFYAIKPDGHVEGLPSSHELGNDAAAVKEAKQLVNGHDIEIWHEARLVAYVTPDNV